MICPIAFIMDQSALRFFIIEKDIFIASDMRAGLEDACKDCEIHDVRHVDELQAKFGDLHTGDSRSVFITNLNLDRIDSTGLAALAGRMAGDIVVREGSDPTDRLLDRGYHILPSPFSSSNLTDLVDRLAII